FSSTGKNLAEAEKELMDLKQLPPCDPSQTQMANAKVDDCINAINKLEKKVSEQEPPLNQEAMLASKISDILNRANPDEPFYGLSDADRAQITDLLDQVDTIADLIDSQGPFWNDAATVIDDLQTVLGYYTMPTGNSENGSSGGGGGGSGGA